jgi:hypothetical protein
MSFSIESTPLRSALQAMTSTNRGLHERRIKELQNEYSHSIAILAYERGPYGFNCAMYALGLENDSGYIELAKRCIELDPNENPDPKYQGVHADTGFVQFLISEGFLSELSSGAPGELLVYFESDQIKHIARVVSERRSRSKWGMGHLYEHAHAEVPIDYGRQALFFASIPKARAIAGFVAYAASKGIDISTPRAPSR